jgi:2'-5' RNA ligase
VSGGLRLFIAAEPPPAVREELTVWARRAIARSVQAHRLSTDSLHLTLCFLGEQPPSAIEEIAAVLASMVELFAAVEELHLGAPVWLPPRRPRALAVEIGDPAGALRALRDALVRELSPSLAWQPARERFRPHITLARMRAGSTRVHELPPTPQAVFAPTTATLFRSTLGLAGASYTPLASIPT